MAPEHPRDEDAADDRGSGQELQPEPGHDGQARRARRGPAHARALARPQGEQRRGRQRRRRQASRDTRRCRRPARGGQRDDKRGGGRPRIGHEAACQRGRQGERQGRERGDDQLRPGRSGERVARRDKQGEADLGGLRSPAVREPSGGREVALVEVLPGAGAVLVGQVDVAVGDDRLREQQAARFALAVVAGRPGSEPERARVDGEQDEPEDRRPSHRADQLPPRGLRPRVLMMTLGLRPHVTGPPPAALKPPRPGRSPSAGPRPCPRRS